MIIKYNAVIDKLAGELDKRVLKSKLIASNVANVDTPGYKSVDLDFGEQMESEMGSIGMKRTHAKHMTDGISTGVGVAEIKENPNPGRPDGNNVNVDDEMLKMTENNVQYTIAVQLLSRRMGQMKSAIAKAK